MFSSVDADLELKKDDSSAASGLVSIVVVSQREAKAVMPQIDKSTIAALRARYRDCLAERTVMSVSIRREAAGNLGSEKPRGGASERYKQGPKTKITMTDVLSPE
ncbi:UNVERIFIED_CONTAM: hypothetical protein FKN15_031327 [Acipenser sinensis]